METIGKTTRRCNQIQRQLDVYRALLALDGKGTGLCGMVEATARRLLDDAEDFGVLENMERRGNRVELPRTKLTGAKATIEAVTLGLWRVRDQIPGPCEEPPDDPSFRAGLFDRPSTVKQ